MAKNPTQPSTKLVLDGEVYELLFDFEAIAEAEDITSMALITGITKKDVTAPRISLIRAMLYASLLRKNPKVTVNGDLVPLTPAAAGKLVTQFNYAQVWGRVLDAWVACITQTKDDKADDPTKGRG
jgi:hypothetical protein